MPKKAMRLDTTIEDDEPSPTVTAETALLDSPVAAQNWLSVNDEPAAVLPVAPVRGLFTPAMWKKLDRQWERNTRCVVIPEPPLHLEEAIELMVERALPSVRHALLVELAEDEEEK